MKVESEVIKAKLDKIKTHECWMGGDSILRLHPLNRWTLWCKSCVQCLCQEICTSFLYSGKTADMAAIFIEGNYLKCGLSIKRLNEKTTIWWQREMESKVMETNLVCRLVQDREISFHVVETDKRKTVGDLDWRQRQDKMSQNTTYLKSWSLIWRHSYCEFLSNNVAVTIKCKREDSSGVVFPLPLKMLLHWGSFPGIYSGWSYTNFSFQPTMRHENLCNDKSLLIQIVIT